MIIGRQELPSELFRRLWLPTLDAKYLQYRKLLNKYQSLTSDLCQSQQQLKQKLDCHSHIVPQVKLLVNNNFASLLRRMDKKSMPYQEAIKDEQSLRYLVELYKAVKLTYSCGDSANVEKVMEICMEDQTKIVKHWRFLEQFEDDLKDLRDVRRIEDINNRFVANNIQMNNHLKMLDSVLSGGSPHENTGQPAKKLPTIKIKQNKA